MNTEFFDGGAKPLATLGWPSTYHAAVNMEKYPLDYVQCLRCNHIWNCQFNYEVIPYTDNPNRMFNDGSLWQEYIKKMLHCLSAILPPKPTVIDVGCGEGHFVRDLADTMKSSGRFLGFDPNTSAESGAGIEFIPEYFNVDLDINRYKPDLIIMRHVLEHLENPAEFIEQLSLASLNLQKPIYFFAETPCVDIALNTGRVVDFFYEHPSQFTKNSFTRLMQLGGDIEWIKTDYGGEVVNGLVKLSVEKKIDDQLTASKQFSRQAVKSKELVAKELSDLSSAGLKLVIWGGTGKAATFIQHYELDSNQFPFVVDSDHGKVGSFVPGTGQKIVHASVLETNPADIIIIPTQWRATDIYKEIRSRNISYCKILIEFEGRLVDYELDKHPYKKYTDF